MTFLRSAGPRAALRGRVRAEVALPLLAAYAALATLYAWQAWRRETPTIFTDELELTQLARSIAETGEPARRGEAYGFTTIVPWLTAPLWWIDDAPGAFAAVKYAQALAMTAALFPAYALARIVVSPPWALFAATATVAAPALSYSAILVEEPFAYPIATLALWLVVRAVLRPGWRTLAVAAASCLLAAATRSQLAALGGALVLALLVLGWRTERMRAWRATWSAWDRAGAVALGLGAVFAFSSFMSHRSAEWREVTVLWKGRIVEYGVWAIGAFGIGVGVLPLLALLAVAAAKTRSRDPGLAAFAVVAAASVVSLGWYAAVKGAYLSTVFSSLVLERNLIYLTPLAMTATAVVLERRRLPVWAVLGAGAVVAVVVTSTPTKLDLFPYYEAHGLSILALANRLWAWPAERIDTALVVACVVATAVPLVLRALAAHARRAAVGAALAVAAAVLTWNLTNEVYAADGERDFAARFAANLVRPVDWVDRAGGGGSVVVFGQQMNVDPTGVNLLEFWNRSIDKVWSVDGTAPGPGPTLTPDLARADGTLQPSPGTEFALVLSGVSVQGPVVAQVGTTSLVRLDGGPLRLASNQVGIYSDGWSGPLAAYNRFDVSEDGDGYATATLSRTAFCTSDPKALAQIPSTMRVRLGPIGVGPDKQPALARVTEERVLRVAPCQQRTVLLRPPPGPWRLELVADTFVPADIDPQLGERRPLGVQASFGFTPV